MYCIQKSKWFFLNCILCIPKGKRNQNILSTNFAVMIEEHKWKEKYTLHFTLPFGCSFRNHMLKWTQRGYRRELLEKLFQLIGDNSFSHWDAFLFVSGSGTFVSTICRSISVVALNKIFPLPCVSFYWVPLANSSSSWDARTWSGHKFFLKISHHPRLEYPGRNEVLGSDSFSTVLEKLFLLMTDLRLKDGRILSFLSMYRSFHSIGDVHWATVQLPSWKVIYLSPCLLMIVSFFENLSTVGEKNRTQFKHKKQAFIYGAKACIDSLVTVLIFTERNYWCTCWPIQEKIEIFPHEHIPETDSFTSIKNWLHIVLLLCNQLDYL